MTEPVAAVAVVTPEERAAREREGQYLVTRADGLVIDTPEAYVEVATWVRDMILPMKRKIEETFRPRIKQADQLHKGLLADERRFLAPVESAERVAKGKLAAYDAEQSRLRREAEQAEQRERERQEQAAREQAAAEQRRVQKEAEDRRLAESLLMEQRGDKVAADRLLDAPIPVPVVTPAPVFAPRPVAPPPPKVEGVSYRDVWSAEVEDLAGLVKAVAAGEQPITLLLPNTVALNGMARSLRGAMRIPGVRAVSSRTASVKA